ncbi:D-ribose ABC transporter substrate-binding protein [Actinocorallia aurea]
MPRSLFRVSAALLAAACSAALLSACGADSEDAKDDGKLTIGFINGSHTEYHTCLEKAIKSQAGTSGVEVITANSNQNPATELANLEDMISRRVDAVIVQTVNVDALANDIAKAKAAGIPIYLTAVMPESLDDVLGVTAVDLAGVGKLNAEWVAKDANGAAAEAVVIAGAPGAASDILVGGFEKNLPANVKVVAAQPGMFVRAKAQEVAENLIQAHPNVKYAFVANEDMAFGALQAFSAVGKDVKIVTSNGTEAGVQAIKDGKFAATVSNPATATGRTAVESVVALLNQQPAEKLARTPIELITKDNADTAPQYCLK